MRAGTILCTASPRSSAGVPIIADVCLLKGGKESPHPGRFGKGDLGLSGAPSWLLVLGLSQLREVADL